MRKRHLLLAAAAAFLAATPSLAEDGPWPNRPVKIVSPFPAGSATVMIGGRPALRTTDACACGAMAAVGQPTVQIG